MRDQIRIFAGDTAIYGVATIVQRFISFLLFPFYSHFLTKAEYGYQTTIFVAVAFIFVVANTGMEAAFFKYDSISDDPQSKRRVYWSALSVNWLVALAICAAIALFPSALNTAAFLQLPDDLLDVLRIAAAIIFLDAASTITMGALRMERRAKLFGAIKIASVVVTVAMNVWLVAVLEMGLDGVFLGTLAGSATQFLLTIPFLLRRLPVAIDRELIGPLLRFGVPTLGSALGLIALQTIDRPILLNLTDADTVGLYQGGYRLGIPMTIFVSMFEFAWKPFFLQQARKPNARELYARIFTYFNVVAAAIFLLLAFYIANLAAIPLPFTDGTPVIAEKFWPGLYIVPVVLGAYVFQGWYANFVAGVYIEKRTAALPWVTGLGAGVEAALCFALIPLLGMIGGAWATLAAYAVMAAALLLYIQRYYTIPYEWTRVVRVGIGAVALYTINALLLDLEDRSLQAGLIRFGLLLLFPVWLLLSGFFDDRERRELRRLTQRLRRMLRREPQ